MRKVKAMRIRNGGKDVEACRLILPIVVGLFVFLYAFSARADYFYDKYPEQPQILLRIASAAQDDSTLKSRIIEDTTFYLKKLEYIGPLKASFGTVHVASLFYIRSSPRGSKNPPVGNSYIVFLDKNFKIRSFWKPDMPNDTLQVDGTKLLSGNDVVFDYAHLPATGEVLYDGKVLGIPTWEK